MRLLIRTFKIVFAMAMVLTCAARSQATTVFSFSDSASGLAAGADFSFDKGILTIALINTSTHPVTSNADVLTALFFNTNTTLVPNSGVNLIGSSIYGTPANNPGEGWVYESGFSQYSMNSGISAAGFGVFASHYPNFYTVPKPPLDGTDYGIVSASTGTNVASLKNHGPLFQHTLVFTLSASGNFEIPNSVVFQYGTSLDEPHFSGSCHECTVVPEPSALLLLGFGLAGCAAWLRTRQK